MRTPRAPRLEPRRAARFEAELQARARAWSPSWGLDDGEHDFGRALLKIAARFSSEVAERLDGAGEKMQRGFLDWLAVRGEAARPARMPVVFKLADTAREAVLAQAPVRMQVDAGGTSVFFETETDVRLVPGRLDVVVGADASGDAFYLPPPGLSDLEPLEPLPAQWQLKSFAAAGAKKLQLDPELGLTPEMIVEASGRQFRITQVEKDIVTIEPALTEGLEAQTTVRKVTAFAPFDGAARNRQEHALYLGHIDLLNIEAAATLEIVGAKDLGESVAWQYWGKLDPNDEVGWQPLALADEAEQQPDAAVLKKPKGVIEPRELGAGNSSRWIRAFRGTVDSTASPFGVDALSIRINCNRDPLSCPPIEETASPTAEAMANTTPLVLEDVFFPLGKEPRQFDAFYLGSEEAFSKKGAQVQLCFEMEEDLGDTSLDPELSWEYWNGKGWWKLDVTLDETGHLKTSGALQFSVPTDMAPTDWSGRTNHWIRARLIGGDYGRERVTVTTSPTNTPGVTQQTVERSSEDIHAPSVAKLHISYQICDSVLPTFVLAKDSGSIRDQSDANRTAGAIVEAFVPLAVTLGRLSGAVALPEALEDCPPDCDCPSSPADRAGAASPAAALPVGTPPPASGRALFIGLDAALSEAPVNILLLVQEERAHDTLAPMTIEALVADHFVPIVANDATRALGESGLLSMTFAIEPTPRELFGKTLTWLRLAPAANAPVTEWKPTVRGAYLNAAWASAAETLTRELLGSSEGAPKLTLFLARPPVLRDTLELRVKEPLGEEERRALLEKDPNLVLSAVENLPGDWVLWKRAVDPGDEPATERVYALDEANGEILFGDGWHGAIPPVGRDSIVAFQYQRTEAGAAGSDGAPANSIAARTPLNLVSPVESVEAVFAADQAAGGAPAEADERVVRFGTARLRHRNRAVTARDFEDLALQSSPDIVQSRCFVRPGHRGWLS